MAYVPIEPVGISTAEEMLAWAIDELRRVSEQLHALEEGTGIKVRYAEPTKRQNGMLVYADGTSWNPGSGAGYYERRGGAWVKL